jgi:hypothetical protein
MRGPGPPAVIGVRWWILRATTGVKPSGALLLLGVGIHLWRPMRVAPEVTISTERSTDTAGRFEDEVRHPLGVRHKRRVRGVDPSGV